MTKVRATRASEGGMETAKEDEDGNAKEKGSTN